MEELTGTITNIQRYSLHDGGGIRTVAFFKGCPFRCPWCSNPENLSFEPQVSFNRKLCIGCSAFGADGLCVNDPAKCPTGAKQLLGESRGVGELVDVLERDRLFYATSGGGVTLSGGECLAAPDFALAVLAECKRRGLSTAVETTFALRFTEERLEGLAQAVDSFLVDFKLADRAESLSVTGIDVDLRDRNLRFVLDRGATVVARMPIIPGYTDSPENVRRNVARICELGIVRVDILPFHQLGAGKYDSLRMDYQLGGQAQLSERDVAWVFELCQKAGLEPTVHGD